MTDVLKKFFSLLTVIQLVVGLAMPALAAEAGLKVLNSTAGTPVLAMLQGEAGSVVDLAVTNPFGSTIKQKVKLGSQGTAQFWYPSTNVAGQYTFAYAGQQQVATVNPGQPNIAKSKLDIDYTTFMDQLAQGTISLRDSFGNAIAGYQLQVQSKKNGQISCAQGCLTNRAGEASFTVKAKDMGLETITVSNTKGQQIFQEQIGFIPRVQQSQPQFTPQLNNYNYGPYQYAAPQSYIDYLPIFDPTRASSFSQGNDDRFLAQNIPSSNFNSNLSASLLEQQFLLAQIENDLQTTQTSTVSTQVAQAGQVSSFDIEVGTDLKNKQTPSSLQTLPEGEVKKITVAANTAQDISVRAVDQAFQTVSSYSGTIHFELDPVGPLLPPDFQFNLADQGDNLFELALILPAGEYSLIVTDVNNPNLRGEIMVTAQAGGSQTTINNTNITLSLDSPIADGIYSTLFPVQGTTNTDNTQIIVKEGPLELKRVDVDENKSFNFPLDLADGVHQLSITAIYLVDGSQVTSDITVEVDQTPPVITQIDAELPAVKANENFTMTVIAEADAKLEAFIDNRSYSFRSDLQDPTKYVLTAAAPAQAGEYPVTLRISDQVGNTDEVQNAATLSVQEAIKEIKNLFGIPGVGTMTLSWDPVENAASYEVSYTSSLGTPGETMTSSESNLTVENLAGNVSYIFTVTAKDASGAAASLPTETRALRALEPPTGAVGGASSEGELRPAADTTPKKHTQSGPEVYLFVLASIFILNCYGQMRKALSK